MRTSSSITIVCIFALLLGCKEPNHSDSTPTVSPDESSNASNKVSYKPEELHLLEDRAEEAGSVEVIVRLSVAFTPEGNLTKDELKKQRREIQDTQDELLSILEGTDFALINRYTTTPSIALELTPEAVRELDSEQELLENVTINTQKRPLNSFHIPKE